MGERVTELDMAKGTAMVLVVVGHVVSRNNYAPGAEWYLDFRALIYLFHMPLFMALSGMALGLSWRHREAWGQVGTLVGKRVKQLMVPFIVFGVLIVAGKLLASRWTTIDNPPPGFLEGILSIVLTPMASPSGFLWYIQVLAIYYMVTPWLLQWSARWAPWALLITGVALQGQPLPTLLNLDYCVEYLPFFSAGLLLGQHWPQVKVAALSKQGWPIWMLFFAAALAYSHLQEPLPKWLVGALSVPFILTAHQAVSGRLEEALVFIGNHTLSIYLMNTICIGVTKALLKPVIPWAGDYFYVYMVVLTVAGLLIPIGIKTVLIKMRPSLAQYL
jgi:fucose 4-O-acetylase-like acetyltransferase